MHNGENDEKKLPTLSKPANPSSIAQPVETLIREKSS